MGQTHKASFHAVAEALRLLAKEKGTDVALRCVTEALGPAVESDTIRGLETCRGGIRRLLGSRDSLLIAPGEDHSQLYSKDGQPCSLVTHPYEIGGPTMEEIVRFCQEQRLTASITGRSSYSIGRTVCLEYRKAGNE